MSCIGAKLPVLTMGIALAAVRTSDSEGLFVAARLMTAAVRSDCLQSPLRYSITFLCNVVLQIVIACDLSH